MNMYRFLSRKNTHLLKTFCFVFRHGCLLLVREESNKKTQVSWVWIDQSFRKSCWDRIVDWRISPIVWFDFCRWEKFKWNLYVIISKIIVLLGKLFKRILEHNWKHIFVLPIREYWERTKMFIKSFSTSDGQMFVKAIRSCLSESSMKNQEILTRIRSSHEFEADDYSSKRRVGRMSSSNYRRSPSPIWKRRTISFRKRPMSMPNEKKNWQRKNLLLLCE